MEEEFNAINKPVKFCESFWGEKYNGWEILYKNFRNSLISVKEFEQYLRECAYTEDTYVKNLDKIKLQIQKFSSDSPISPVFNNIFKDLNQSNSGVHLHFKYRIEELIKEIQNYYDDLRKKKHKIKENEIKTQQLVETIRNSTINLAKSKELFFQATLELDKQTNDIQTNQNQNSSPNLATQMMLQKQERKCQTLREEYLLAIEKYNTVRIEFEQRFTESCNLFQTEEELHLKKMRAFIMNYTQLVAQLNSSRQKNFSDSQQKLTNVYTNEILLQQFVLSKSTGQEKPIEAQLVEPNFDNFESNTRFSRSSFSSQIQRSPTVFDSPDSLDNNVNGGITLENTENDTSIINFSSSVPSASNTPRQSNKFAPKSVELRKRSDTRGFNILEMFARANKNKTENSVNTSKKSKFNDNLTKNNLSSSYSFIPNFLFSSTSREDSKTSDTEAQLQLANKTVVDAVSDAFDKQLKQIDSFEQELSNKQIAKTTTSDPMDINYKNSNSNDESHERKRVSRIISHKGRITFDESPVTSSASPVNAFRKREDKPSIGSLLTATSLDNNNFFDNSSFFENLDDYIDSINSVNPDASKDFFCKMNELNQSNQNEPSQLYAFSESSSEDDENKPVNKTPKNSTNENDYDNVINNEDIDDDDDDLNDSNDDSDDSDAPKKVFLRIKPLSEVDLNLATSPEVLREISKNLQLRPNTYITKKKVINQRNIIFQTANATDSLTSISSINNILPSSSPSMSSERDASRSASALSMQNNNSIKEEPSQEAQPLNSLDENNNLNGNVNIFQMDKATNAEKLNIAPPLPPLPLTIKKKYQDILYSKYSQNIPINMSKSKSESGSLENLNFDCLSDLSMNNSPVMNGSIRNSLKVPGESFAKF